MKHLLCRVVRFAVVGDYRVQVEFDDGVSRTIDLAPILEGELFGPLRDPALFRSVALDAEAHTLVWPNGADLDPATLHDWPEYADEMRVRGKQWAVTAAAKAHDQAAPPERG